MLGDRADKVASLNREAEQEHFSSGPLMWKNLYDVWHHASTLHSPRAVITAVMDGSWPKEKKSISPQS